MFTVCDGAAEAEIEKSRERDGEQCSLCVCARKTEMERSGYKIKQETRPQKELLEVEI